VHAHALRDLVDERAIAIDAPDRRRDLVRELALEARDRLAIAFRDLRCESEVVLVQGMSS
jgi:hypothetical protein